MKTTIATTEDNVLSNEHEKPKPDENKMQVFTCGFLPEMQNKETVVQNRERIPLLWLLKKSIKFYIL